MPPVILFPSYYPPGGAERSATAGGGTRHVMTWWGYWDTGGDHSSSKARPRVGCARVPASRGGSGGRAGSSVTRCRAERAEHTGWGGAESSAEQPLPATAANPGPRPGSMDRSSLLQLIQEQVR